MKKVLITGASGFIGSHCLKFLKQNNFHVFATSSKEKEETAITWLKVNLLNNEEVEKLFKLIKPEYLLHLAWYVDPKTYLESTINLDWVRSSIHICQEFVKNGGKRAVFAGTCAEYDWKNEILHENSPCLPATLYGTCKYSLFKILEKFSLQNNLSFAWGRIFNLYGPREAKSRFIPYLINSFLNGQTALCNNPDLEKDFLFVEDVSKAFVELLDSDFFGPVNIASGNALPLKNIVLLLSKMLKAENLVQFSPNPSNAKQIAGVTLLKKLIKFDPVKLEEGLKITIDWWKNKGNEGKFFT